MRGSRSPAALLVLAFYTCIAAPTFAQTPGAREADSRAAASETFREAQAAFARRDFAAAAAAFEQTARTLPHATTWLNAAEAWEKRGDWVRAAEDCDRALGVPDTAPEIRREAERRLAVALPRVATLEVRGPRGFTARIDGSAEEALPIKRRLPPGPHRVVVTELRTTREQTHQVLIAAGATRTIEVSPEASPAAPRQIETTTPPPREARSVPTASCIAWGAGGALAATAGVLGVQTLNAKAAYEDGPTQKTLDTFRRDRLLTNTFAGGAIVALGVGVVVWLVSGTNRSDRAGRFAAAPLVGFEEPWRPTTR